jgi:translocation and assembly module TamB
MRRVWLAATLMLLLLISGSIAALLTSETALLWLFPRIVSWSGIELTVTQVSGRIIGPISMTNVTYRSKAFNAHADRLTLDWQPRGLLGATLRLRPVRVEHLVITLPQATPPGLAATPGTAALAPGAVRLPLRIALKDAEITHLEIIDPKSASPTRIERVQLSFAAFGNSAQLDNVRIETQAAYAELSGRLGLAPTAQVDLNVRGTWAPPGQPMLSGDAHIRGDGQRLNITANLSAPLKGQLTATLDTPYTRLRWNAVLQLTEIAAQQINPAWPALQLRGRLEGHGSTSQLQSQGELQMSGAVNGQAKIRFTLEHRPKAGASKPRSALADYPMALDLDWHTQPLAAAQHGLLRSHSGKLVLRGVPDRYTFSLNSQLNHATWHAITLDANGTGDNTSLKASALARLFDGSLNASGAWRWSKKPDWRISLRAKNINPARYDANWPGQLSLAADLHGDYQHLRLDNATVAGTLRGQPLQLNTRLAIDSQGYTLEHLSADLGSASARAAGSAINGYTLTWDIQAPDLSQLLPDARGALSTRGKLAGPRDKPRVNASIEGEGLVFRGYGAQHLALQFDLDRQDKQDSSLRLELGEVILPQGDLKSLTLQAQGRLHTHSINLALDAGGTHAMAGLSGSFSKNVWTGRLTDSELSSEATGAWRLERPAALVVAADAVSLAEGCLHQAAGRVCAHGAWRRPVGWDGTAMARQFPLSLIQPLFLQDIGLTGSMDADITARTPLAGAPSVTAELRFSPGNVRYPASGELQVQVEYDAAVAYLRAAEGRAQSRFSLRLKNQGTLDANLAFPLVLPDSPPPADVSLQGDLRAAFHDLSPLALFFPQLYQTRGTLDASWRVRGTLEHPRFSGQLTLNDGSTDIPRLGIHLRETRLSLSGDGSDVLHVKGRMLSGKGTLDLDGSIDLGAEATWSSTLHLTGSHFELANTPEVFLLATPDLTLDARPHTLRLEGKIDIPEGRIAPKDLASATLASSDVVMVGVRTAASRSPKWNIYSRVQLNLGEKIHFAGFNFKGDITGNIIVVDEPERQTTALGELRVVQGQYSIYRQDLNIERGRLIFASGPLNDPGLDMRAVRRTGDVLAGVLARGTLKSPELLLFSEPSMSDTDTLSYLMLGRPADQAGRADGELLYQAASSLGAAGGELLAKKIGNVFGLQDVTIKTGSAPEDTALVIGTYLSPRLYINYGIGLLEPVNTFRMRYKLNKNWQFQSETGVYSGADILYTIER